MNDRESTNNSVCTGLLRSETGLSLVARSALHMRGRGARINPATKSTPSFHLLHRTDGAADWNEKQMVEKDAAK